MADTTRYQASGLGYSSYPITPGLDAAGSRAKAQATGDIASLLDRMGQSLYKTAVDEAQRQGMEWGSANPVSVDQLQAAVASGEDPLATRHTYFGDAARKVQAAVISSNLNALGIGEMAKIQAQAELGQLDMRSAAEKMDAISNSYAGTLAKIDPESAIKLRGALTSHSASIYKYLAGEEVRRATAVQKATADQFIQELPKTLESIYLAGDLVGADGVVQPAEARVNAQRSQARLLVAITKDSSYGDKFEKAVIEAKRNALTRVASSDWFATDAATAVTRVAKGDFGDYATLYNSLAEDEKVKVRQGVRNFWTDQYSAEESVKKQQKQDDILLSNELITTYYKTRDPKIIKQLEAISARSDALSPQTIHELTKSGEGEAKPQSLFTLKSMIYNREITTPDQLAATGKRLGIPPKILAESFGFMVSRNEDEQREVNQAIQRAAKMVPGTLNPTQAQAQDYVAVDRMVRKEYQRKLDEWDATPAEKRGPKPSMLAIAEAVGQARVDNKLNQQNEALLKGLNDEFKPNGISFTEDTNPADIEAQASKLQLNASQVNSIKQRLAVIKQNRTRLNQ